MTTIDWNDILQLPPSALAGKRLAKAALVRNTRLTRTEQKTLTRVAGIEYFASVQKSTTRIPPHVDDERDIESIIVLKCTLVDAATGYAEPAHILHRCFPNPTVLLFERSSQMCVSCATTRRNLAEHDAAVVDSITMTAGFEPRDERYTPLLASLAFNALPQDDLYVYLSEFSWRVRLGRLVNSLGFYPTCDPSQRNRLLDLSTAYDHLSAQRNAIDRQRHDSGLSLNDSAKLRVQQRTLDQRIEAILTAIKEISHE